MALFRCEGIDANGRKVREDLQASNCIEAASRIRAMGYFPIRVQSLASPDTQDRAGAPSSDRRESQRARRLWSFGWVSRKQLCQFTRQLSVLQDAGLSVHRSLRILEQHHAGPLRSILRRVIEDIEAGATLSEALGKHRKVFDRLYVNMVHAGETGGVLEVVLRDLADYLEARRRLNRKIRAASIYPTTILVFTYGMLMVIMGLIVPCFEDLYDDFGRTLPEATQFLIDASNWLIRDHGWASVLAGYVGLGVFEWALARCRPGRYAMNWVADHLPIVGGITGRRALSRFARTLGILFGAGVPIVEALRTTRQVVGNEVYAHLLDQMREAVTEGESLASPLRRSRVLDPVVVSMIEIGEQTGQIDKMLLKIAGNCDEEVDVLVRSLLSVFEPVMIIWTGIVVGYIVLAMFMPMICILY